MRFRNTDSSARFAAAGALLAVLYFVSVPAEPRYQLCAFHWLTGRLCPLCGLTRGLFALAKGRIGQAEQFNALSPLGFAMVFSLFWGPTSFSNPTALRQPRVLLWKAGVVAFALYGAFRAMGA